MFDLWIKNAVIIGSKALIKGSVIVHEGKIVAIQEGNKDVEAYEVIDLEGKYLFPGMIDGHVHFNEPGYTWREDFEHGSRSAVVGGVTTIIDMPMLNKPAVSDSKAFQDKWEIVREKAVCDYGFWGALVNYNFGDLEGLNEAGALAYKCFMCPVQDDYTSLDHQEIEKALHILKTFDGVAGFHCEDYAMIEKAEKEKLLKGETTRLDYLISRPVEAELKAVKEVIQLAEASGARVHICHVSHPLVAEEIKRAKTKGIKITAETCIHYLIYSGEDLISKGMLYKCSPPLRAVKDSEKLWDYVIDGTLDCICSDHSPAKLEEKGEERNGAFGAWGGLSGVQTSLQIYFDWAVHKKGLSPTLIVNTMAENPAKLFGIYGQKGAIEPGFDADFVVVDPEIEWEITEEVLQYKNKISAFVGEKGKGLPVCTILRGKVVSMQGEIKAADGYGRLVTKKRC